MRYAEVIKKTDDLSNELHKIFNDFRFQEPIKKMPFNICPRCQIGFLRRIEGRYGSFMGCSQYPNCRYTRNLTR